MQVAKYWRNKQLRYRLARKKRVRQALVASPDKMRLPAAAAQREDEPLAAGLIQS